jgi:rubrerythrin
MVLEKLKAFKTLAGVTSKFGIVDAILFISILCYEPTITNNGRGGTSMDKRVSDIIEIAIKREEDAYGFYMDIHSKVGDPDVKETLEFIAGEEKKHKAFLVNYRDGNFGAKGLRMSDVVEYKIAEYLEEPEVDENMKPEDVYLVASHREHRSYRFYTELANLHADGELREMLLKMANEELKHKEKMEYLYANTAFPQTSGG